MYDIRIVYVNAYGELRKNIYENVQHSIPAELKKDYPYCENGLFEIPLFEDSNEYKYVIDVPARSIYCYKGHYSYSSSSPDEFQVSEEIDLNDFIPKGVKGNYA